MSRELQLASELKALCDENGKETDINLSAQIFHQFGILYSEKGPDKISLIRSAVFYNAALSRQPSNSQFNAKLKELCTNVLKFAKAKQQDADLIHISKKVLKSVIQMRKRLKKQLQLVEVIPVGLPLNILKQSKKRKISSVKKLQKDLTNDFTNIMKCISDKCIQIMGKPPCQYAVVGMGSLARQEITPYSDFEHVIVLEEGVKSKLHYDDVLEYFRWFTVIFQLIIINLGETIIPCIAVPLLNNSNIKGGDWFFDAHTTRGLSFDGMMMYACKFPLGRTQKTDDKPWSTELIKPVSEMANYLKLNEEIKNGYHLADILTRTCFVSGNKCIYEDFQSLTQVVLQEDAAGYSKQIKLQLKEDMETYDAFNTINAVGTVVKWNIKRVIYRSTSLFVSGLGRLHSIEKYSCFDIIDTLLRLGKLSSMSAQSLSFAIAVACETRLRVYMLKENQHDSIGDRDFYTNEHKAIRCLCQLIGEQSLGDYFVTTVGFQTAISRSGINGDSFSISFEFAHKFPIFFNLGLRNLILAEWERCAQNPNLLSSNCDFVVRYYVAWTFSKNHDFETALRMYNELENEIQTKPDFFDIKIKGEIVRRKAHCLCEAHRYEEGLRYIKKCLSKVHGRFPVHFHQVAYLLAVEGDCKRKLNLRKEAICSYARSLEFSRCSISIFRKHLQAKCQFFIGQCQASLGNFESAIKNAKFSLETCQDSNIEASLMCKCYRLMGDCHVNLNQPLKAWQCFKEELKLRQKEMSEQNNNLEELETITSLIQATELKVANQ